MDKYVLGILSGIGLYSMTLAYFIPPTLSCEMAFIRQTVDNPAWAKTYWEKVAKLKQTESQ